MARPLRLEHEGAVFHVTSRGNERKKIYRNDADRRRFLQMLGEAAERYNWNVLDYTLMDNHFHLVIETPECTLSRGMQWLKSVYAQSFNRKYKRVGHLFQGRFGSELVEKGEHLDEVLRYVVLNPVRAGMVERPEEYEWSSYRAKVGLAPRPEWLSVDWTLTRYGRTPEQAIEGYKQYVEAGIGLERSPWDDLVGQTYLGSPEWIDEMKKLVEAKPRSEEHPRAQREIGRPTMGAVVEAVAKTYETTAEVVCTRALPAARMLAAWLGWNEGLLRLRQIRAAFHLRSNGTISDLIRRCARELERDPVLRVAASSCRRMLAAAPAR